ncbi:hypothetical protein ACIPSA_44750 [Streptomyces sp. NPDC086549]|uniref:hypothetical protein n=1 Tax=Streptomyces sp. NPDC086549 TaxID=3365752 RepID=UPI00380622FC
MTWRRVALVLLLAGLEASAMVMVASGRLSSAGVGVLLAALGWLTAARIATWHPAPAESPVEEPTRR